MQKGSRPLETVIEPQEWPDNHVDWSDYSSHATRSWGRGFFVLAQAASMLNLEHLRSFNVDAGIDGRPSGIVHSVFQMSDWEKMYTCNAFWHLTKIVLHVNVTIPSDGGWTNTLIYAKIQAILGSARSLAHLDLGLDPPLDIPRSAVSELPALLGTHC